MRRERFVCWTAAMLLPALPLMGQDTAPPEIELNIVEVPSPAETAASVSVEPLSNFADVPDEFWTHGAYGDLVLKNDFASLVFGAIPDNRDDFNQARQGSVLDIFTSPSAPEGFQVFQPTTDHRLMGRTVLATAIDPLLNEERGSGRVIVFGELAGDDSVTVDTTYDMEKGWPGVKVTTEIANDSAEEKLIPILGDYVGWGAMMPFASGSGWVNRSGTVGDCEFVFGRYQDSLVMIAPTEGLFEYRQTSTFSILVYERDIVLQPGERRVYQRWLLTGQDDPGKLYSFLQEQKAPASHGYMAGRVVEMVEMPDGRPMESGIVPDAEVRISIVQRPDLPKAYVLRPYIFTNTDEFGNFQIALPAGEYTAAATSSSRLFEPSNLGIRVNEGRITPGTIAVSKPSTLVFEVYDGDTGESLPAKISLIPLRGTNQPDLGPPGGLASGSSAYSPSGKGVIEVPAGSYRVIASHGNEYHMEEQRINVRQSQNVSVRFELRRAFRPDGWIAADLGVMTNASPHSRTTPVDRLITAAAEGLQWIVTADLNTATNLQPLIERTGLSKRLRASTGLRLGSSRDHSRGEYLLFPVEFCSAGSNLSLDALFATSTVEESVSLLRSLCPSAILVAHRPIFPLVGMLSVQGYDPDTGRFPDQELLLDVDALQIWEGKRQGIVNRALEAYNHVLSQGEYLTPLAYSMSAGTFNEEPGYPRVYLPSDTRDPREFDIEDFARSIRDGRVLLTNGPFIDLKVNGSPMGSMISETSGTVEVELRVFAPNWANVSDIIVNLNGKFARRFILPAGSIDPEAGQVYPRPDEEDTFRLTVRSDSILTVIVEGDPSLPQDPVNPLVLPTVDMAVQRGQRTFAISAPVFIDADGDGVLDIDWSEFRRADTVTTDVPPF